MRPRLLILPFAAAVITALCTYKATRTYPETAAAGAAEVRRPAPLFQLYDQKKPSELVRLSSYLGRHPILLVFFDGDAGPDQSPVLLELRDRIDDVRRAGGHVFALSAALPQDNRLAEERGGRFPFPLLSDPDFSVHRAWGRYDTHAARPLSGVFLIDRGGRVAWQGGFPSPSPDRAIDRWPGEG